MERPPLDHLSGSKHIGLTHLLEGLKMGHLLTQLDGVCKQAAKGNLDYQGFLIPALEAE